MTTKQELIEEQRAEIIALELDNLELQGQIESMNATLALVEMTLITLQSKLETL